jgi:hypothetical protein
MFGIIGAFPSNNAKVIFEGIRKFKHRDPDDDAIKKQK